jgi:hypothetical protein
MADVGAKYGYTMAQIGHKSAKLTLEVYTDADNRGDSANEQIGTLLRTPEWAQTGTNLPGGGRNGSSRQEVEEAGNAEAAEETT